MKFIRTYILNDWKLKGLSFVLAIMLWLGIYHAGVTQMSISVRLVPEHLNKDFIIENLDTDDVLVTVSGPVSLLKNLGARDIRVPVDLSDVQKGRHTISLKKSDIVVPTGIQVESVKPDYFVVAVERAVEKRLKIVVKLHTRWANVYRVKSSYPQYVTVEGSHKSLEQRDHIETVPIDGTFLQEQEELDVALDGNNMLLRKMRPETVRVVLERK